VEAEQDLVRHRGILSGASIDPTTPTRARIAGASTVQLTAMPDDLALAANLVLTLGALGAGVIGVVAAAIWRAAARVPEGFFFGAGVGAAAWSTALLAVAAAMGGWVEQMHGGVAVEGRLLGFERSIEYVRRPGQSSFADGRPVAIVAPTIEFTARDGRVHRVQALGGSLSGLQPGDPVPLRYDPARPEAAVVEDFQNRYGAAMLFFNLGVIAAMAAVWCVLNALLERRGYLTATAAAAVGGGGKGRKAAGTVPPAPAPTGRFARWRDAGGHRWSGRLFRLGLAQLALGIVLPMILGVASDIDLLKIFAVALASVSLAFLWFGAASALKRGARDVGVLLWGRAVGVVGFGLFAAWLAGLGIGR
jgi:hypothetical protein